MDASIQDIIIALVSLLLLIGYLGYYLKFPDDFKIAYKRFGVEKTHKLKVRLALTH